MVNHDDGGNLLREFPFERSINSIKKGTIHLVSFFLYVPFCLNKKVFELKFLKEDWINCLWNPKKILKKLRGGYEKLIDFQN